MWVNPRRQAQPRRPSQSLVTPKARVKNMTAATKHTRELLQALVSAVDSPTIMHRHALTVLSSHTDDLIGGPEYMLRLTRLYSQASRFQ